jgi:hypothetical protein
VALRDALGAPVLGPDREDYERCLSAVRAAGGCAADVAWEQGYAAPAEVIASACYANADAAAPRPAAVLELADAPVMA